MDKTKFVERLPDDQGAGLLKSYPAVKTPWGKMYDWHFACQYIAREAHVISAAMLGAIRCLVPDYEERARIFCEATYESNYNLYKGPIGKESVDQQNMHPFARGCFMGALLGDYADESLLMTGRVNDFGTYRVEKELDTCPWDIVGSEVCRATTAGFEGIADGIGEHQPQGPHLEFNMVEALGCGDLHCRIVAENREKYPMPPKPRWEPFGPIATADQVQFTPEEEQYSESAFFRRDADHTYVNGVNHALDASACTYNMQASAGECNVQKAFEYGVREGMFTEEQVIYAVKAVCEAAGKAAFGSFYAKAGAREFLGVPQGMSGEDTRILGGIVEMFLQTKLVPYEVEKFDGEETIIVFERALIYADKFLVAMIAYWYGAAKTLLSAKFALWEEDSPEGKVRLKIARKIDKYC